MTTLDLILKFIIGMPDPLHGTLQFYERAIICFNVFYRMFLLVFNEAKLTPKINNLIFFVIHNFCQNFLERKMKCFHFFLDIP